MGNGIETANIDLWIVWALWGVTMAFVGAKGVQYVAKIGLYLNGIPLLMVLVVFLLTTGGTSALPGVRRPRLVRTAHSP